MQYTFLCMKINTSTKIKNLVGDEFTTIKDGKEQKLLLGDVLFGALNNATGIELKISWALMPKLAQNDLDITLDEDQKRALIKALEQAAQLPQNLRYNLIVYGRAMDLINGVEDLPKTKGKKNN